jgi:uncharacterized OB-fold protein
VNDTVAVHDGLFREEDGVAILVGGRCRACTRHHFPLLTTCPYCSSQEVEEAALPGDGTLWSWTAVTAAPPGYRGEVPYGFGVVELPAVGLRVITRLTEPDPARLAAGQAMTLRVVPLHTDDEGRTVTTYAFGPAP